MEDYKTMKDIVNFALAVVLLLVIILVVYKFGKNLDARRELYFKESELTDLKIENEKMNSKILNKTLEVNGIENGQ